jgi:hypothetical protein
MGKHSSLLRKILNYGQKSFTKLATGDENCPEIPDRVATSGPGHEDGDNHQAGRKTPIHFLGKINNQSHRHAEPNLSVYPSGCPSILKESTN